LSETPVDATGRARGKVWDTKLVFGAKNSGILGKSRDEKFTRNAVQGEERTVRKGKKELENTAHKRKNHRKFGKVNLLKRGGG